MFKSRWNILVNVESFSRLKKSNYVSLSPRLLRFIAKIKGIKPRKLDTRIPHFKKRSTYAAGSWPGKCTTYLLFMGSSLLPKDSCGPETADKHTKPASFFIWARHWLQMPRDSKLNHKHAIIWCDLLSPIQCKHMVVTPLLIRCVGDGNCHFVGMRALRALVWGERWLTGAGWSFYV